MLVVVRYNSKAFHSHQFCFQLIFRFGLRQINFIFKMHWVLHSNAKGNCLFIDAPENDTMERWQCRLVHLLQINQRVSFELKAPNRTTKSKCNWDGYLHSRPVKWLALHSFNVHDEPMYGRDWFASGSISHVALIDIVSEIVTFLITLFEFTNGMASSPRRWRRSGCDHAALYFTQHTVLANAIRLG